MKAIPLTIPDIIIFEPKIFGDDRGFFFESFNQIIFKKLTGISPTFVQDNHSKSIKRVLRGLHYQLPPKEQGKLIRAIQGEIFDDIEVKLEYRNKYDNSARESKQGRIDLGFAYKLKKLKIGLYYREIYNLKNDLRVSEFRPHLDITYKLNDNMKIRYRNEFRIKELDDNVFRHRLRYSYSLKIFDNYNSFNIAIKRSTIRQDTVLVFIVNGGDNEGEK